MQNVKMVPKEYIQQLPKLRKKDMELVFTGCIKRGIYSIDSLWNGKFVAQRIIPPDGQNLGTILNENVLKVYGELKLLRLSEGRCAQNDICLVRIWKKEILPEIQERFHEKVLDVMAFRDWKILAFFRDGLCRVVDIGKKCGDNRLFGNVLRSEEVFRNLRVSPSGNGIEWGGERILAAEMLRKSGKNADISYRDLIGLVITHLVYTAETTKLLNCSRQYIK